MITTAVVVDAVFVVGGGGGGGAFLTDSTGTTESLRSIKEQLSDRWREALEA